MLSGRDRAAHPFLIYADACTGETRSSLNLELTLIGKGTEYLPYIAYSLQRAGKSGLFRERVTYDITTSKLNGEYLIDEDGTLKADVPTSLWSIDSSDTPVDQKLRIEFITPLRLRIQGRYTDRFRPNDIIDASARRLAILSDLYGKGGTDTGRLSCDGITVTDQSFKWVDHPYYSSRQGTKMQMGGVTGFMDIKGSISPAQLSVLKGGELFHIGKNTGFGLGKISVARM